MFLTKMCFWNPGTVLKSSIITSNFVLFEKTMFLKFVVLDRVTEGRLMVMCVGDFLDFWFGEFEAMRGALDKFL